MTIRIELDYPVLSDDHEVWLVRPGARYRLASLFRAEEAFAPDAPFLDLSDGKPARPKGERAERSLRRQARRARAWREWEKKPSDWIVPPSQDANDYSLSDGFPTAETKLRNNVVRLLDEIPAGALLFIPGASLEEDALLGLAAPPSAPRIRMSLAAHERKIPFLGRPIINPLNIPMRSLPREITDIRLNRGVVSTAFSQRAKERLYREYFGTYSTVNGVSFAQFRGGDKPFPVGDLANLEKAVRFIAEAHRRASAARGLEIDLEPITQDQLLRLMWAQDRDVLLHARIDSPFGRATFESGKRLIFAAIALIALAELDDDARALDELEAGQIRTENVCIGAETSREHAERQMQEVRESLYDFRAVLGATNCEEVLKALRSTVESTKGEVDAKAKR